jgi:hypothetical protein
MKTSYRMICGAVCGLILMATLKAGAQGYGLPTAESYEPREDGCFDITAGAVFGHDLAFYGLRDTFAALETLRFFVDVGIIDPPDSHSVDLAAQAGAVYCLPFDLPNDMYLGVRGALYTMNADKLDVSGGNVMLLMSRQTYFKDLFLYGGVGGDARRVKKVAADGRENSDHKLNPILALGALMPMTQLSEHLFFYAELTVTDDPFIGVGIRYR